MDSIFPFSPPFQSLLPVTSIPCLPRRVCRTTLSHSLLTGPTLCDPLDYSPPGSFVHSGILQARILKWVSISSSRGSSRLRDWTQVSGTAGIFFTTWATREAPFFGLFQFPHALNLGTSGGQLKYSILISVTQFWCLFPLQFGKPLFNSPVFMGKEVP